MYNIKPNRLNGLSGYLMPQNETIEQKEWRENKNSFAPLPLTFLDKTQDGTLIYDNKYFVNYTLPENFLHWKKLYKNPVGDRIGDRYILIGKYGQKIGNIEFTRRIYKDIKTNNQYIDLGPDPDIQVLVRILKEVQPNLTTGTTVTTSTEPDCPCDCDKQIVTEQVYINPVRLNPTDTPIKIKVQKRVCTSKNNDKKYIFDCDTSIAEINRQLNTGLNGLASGINEIGKNLIGGSGGTGAKTTTNNVVGDCPCDCIDQLVEQTYYISSQPTAGSIPFTVSTEKIVCNDTNQIMNKKVDCEELKSSLRARGFTTLADRFDCMTSNGSLQDSMSDDNIFTKNDYLIPKLTATFVGIFAVSKYLMK